MKLQRVTVSGADDLIGPTSLARLGETYPFAEWGILLSATREGSVRYPSRAWVDQLVEYGGRLALAGHLCGRWAREAAAGPFYWAVERYRHFDRFGRLQFNGVEPTAANVNALAKLADRLGKTVIVQLPAMRYLTDGHLNWPILFDRGGIEFLIDGSGGTGKPLDDFEPPPAVVNVGYAGGIGPENVRAVLERLTRLEPAHWGFWIDMESGVRLERDGRSMFDFDKVRAALDVAAEFVRP